MTYEAVDDFENDVPAPPKRWLTTTLTVVPLLAVVGAGWTLHQRNLLDPMEGVGYVLGIVGAMALLVAVFRSMLLWPGNWLAAWIDLPALLALAGCGTSVVHANFQWGTRASSMAQIAVLVVTASTLMGLLIQRRVQAAATDRGNSGAQLQANFAKARAGMSEQMSVSPALQTYLEQFEAQELPRHSLLLSKCLRVRRLPDRLDSVRQRAMKFLRQVLESRTLDEDWTPEQLQLQLVESTKSLGAYLDSLRAMAEYDAFHRLYVIWRLSQLALMVLLILTLSVHVYSVHAY